MSRTTDGDVAATCAMEGIGDSIHDPSDLQRIDAQMVSSVRFGRQGDVKIRRKSHLYMEVGRAT